MNTNGIGAKTEGLIMAALLRAGKTVLTPFGVQRYDLVFEDESGFHRVQCKTGRMIGGAMVFEACSRHSRTLKRSPYQGDVDFFGVYLPYNGQCYLVPIEKVPGPEGRLRIEPSRQGKKITYAVEFLLGPA